jgi:hypothetical protein
MHHGDNMSPDSEYELIEKTGHLEIYRSRITGQTLSRISSPAPDPGLAPQETKIKLFLIGAECTTAKQLIALRQMIPGWQTLSVEDIRKACNSDRFYIGEFYPEHASALISKAESLGIKLVST